MRAAILTTFWSLAALSAGCEVDSPFCPGSDWTCSPGRCFDDPQMIELVGPVDGRCRCEDGLCEANSCALTLSLHPSCAERSEFARVAIDGHLERERLVNGQPMRPCQRIAPGETAELYVCNERWTWGPLRRECPPQGFAADETISLVFECAEAR